MAKAERCGVCELEFDLHSQYLDHVCEVTGLTPRHPFQTMGPNYLEIQGGARQRGKDRVEREKQEKAAKAPNENKPA